MTDHVQLWHLRRIRLLHANDRHMHPSAVLPIQHTSIRQAKLDHTIAELTSAKKSTSNVQ